MVTMDLRGLGIILNAVLVLECACPTSKKVVNLCEKTEVSGPDFNIDSGNMAEEFETCSCKLFADKSTRIRIKDSSVSPKCQSYKYETNITLFEDFKLISYDYVNGQCKFPVFIGGSISKFDQWVITIERLLNDLDNITGEDAGFCIQVSSDQGGNFTVSCKDPVISVPEESVTEITQTTTTNSGATSTDVVTEKTVETTALTTDLSYKTTSSDNDHREPREEDDETFLITDPVVIISIIAGLVLLIVLLMALIYKKKKWSKVYTRKDVGNIVYIPEPKT